jgi:hypothetical protein
MERLRARVQKHKEAEQAHSTALNKALADRDVISKKLAETQADRDVLVAKLTAALADRDALGKKLAAAQAALDTCTKNLAAAQAAPPSPEERKLAEALTCENKQLRESLAAVEARLLAKANDQQCFL